MSDEAAKNKRPKGRSPSYPAIDLEEAIEKARQLYTAEGQHPGWSTRWCATGVTSRLMDLLHWRWQH